MNKRKIIEKDNITQMADVFGGWENLAREMYPLVDEQALKEKFKVKKLISGYIEEFYEKPGRKLKYNIEFYFEWLDRIKAQKGDRKISRKAVITELLELDLKKDNSNASIAAQRSVIDNETIQITKAISTIGMLEKKMLKKTSEFLPNIPTDPLEEV